MNDEGGQGTTPPDAENVAPGEGGAGCWGCLGCLGLIAIVAGIGWYIHWLATPSRDKCILCGKPKTRTVQYVYCRAGTNPAAVRADAYKEGAELCDGCGQNLATRTEWYGPAGAPAFTRHYCGECETPQFIHRHAAKGGPLNGRYGKARSASFCDECEPPVGLHPQLWRGLH